MIHLSTPLYRFRQVEAARKAVLSMVIVCLCSLLMSASAVAQQSASSPHDYMMPDYYRKPDYEPYCLRSWCDGWSLSLDWQPQLHYQNLSLKGVEWGQVGIGLTKDFSKSDALRLGYAYHHHRHTLSADYLWNLTHYYNGYAPYRRWEWLLTMGVSGGHVRAPFVSADGPDHHSRYFGGGQVGLQLRHTLSPYTSVYVEPQYHVSSPWYDLRMVPYNVADDAFSLRVGVLTRLSPPLRDDQYGQQAREAMLWLAGLGSRIVIPSHIQTPPRPLYTQVLGGVMAHLSSGPYLQPLNLEMNVGRPFNDVYGLQLGVYQQSIRDALSVDADGRAESFGARLELTASLLQAVSAASSDMGWALTFSGGVEAGRLQTLGRSLSDVAYHRYGFTAATQLRRRLAGPLWAVLSGRVQWMGFHPEHQVSSLMLGVHCDVASSDPAARPRTAGPVFLQGGAGWWNARNALYTVSVGYQFTPVHALRADYSFARADVSRSSDADWCAISLDYMADITNAWCGHDPARRYSMHAFAGYSIAFHRAEPSSSLWHMSDYVGIEAGLQFDYRLARHLSLFVEQKSLFLPFDRHLTLRSQDAWHMQGTAGLILRL